MTEFETQLLAGQAILIRQIGQIANDVRWLKQHVIERAKAPLDLAAQIEAAGGLEAAVKESMSQKPK